MDYGEKGKVVFGIASGRNRHITEQAFNEYDLPKPDIVICSAGSEIYYTDKFIQDKGWESHIDYQWKRKELEQALENFPGLSVCRKQMLHSGVLN